MKETEVERVSVRQAAKELNMDMDAVRYLMLEDRLPIGTAVKKQGKKRAAYYIYRGLLDEYKKRLQGEQVAEC